MSDETVRIPEARLERFGVGMFEALGTPRETAGLALRSLLDASLLGVDTHGVEALDMYYDHLRAGGLAAEQELICVREKGAMTLWDMRSGVGLAGARRIMAHAIDRAKEHGMCFATCRRTNHIGACGVYGLMAARQGMVAMISQGSRMSFAPWGGKDPRIGSSPMAFVAPVQGMFPFYYDAAFAMMTGAQMKALIRAGKPLPEGVALDLDGNPTTDPKIAWNGQVLPIGRHKGVGMAMWNEILSCVFSGNQFANSVPSIVSTPERSADSSLYMIVFDPEAIQAPGEFAARMRKYVDYIESSRAIDPANPPRYPGRREGENWNDRQKNGIPVRPDALARLRKIAENLHLAPVNEGSPA